MTPSSQPASTYHWLKYVGLVLGTVGVVAIASLLSLQYAVMLLSMVAIGLTLGLYQQFNLNQRLQQTVHWHKSTLANAESSAQNRQVELQQQLQDIQHQHQTAIEQVDVLTHQLQKAQHTLTKLTTEHKQLQQTTAALDQQLHSSQQAVSDLSLQLEQAKTEQDFYVNQCDRHAHVAQEAQQSLETAINDRDCLSVTQQELSQQLETMRSQLADAQTLNTELQAELTETRQQLETLTPSLPPTYRERPYNMDDERFARFATIELQEFPCASHIEDVAKHHYRTLHADKQQPISFNALVDFLRHRFTNYEALCDELNHSKYYARNILKARVNAEICQQLAQMRISIRN
jgi:hypothetical protein